MTMRPFFRALIPAGILAALVLFVFSTLQYYGPESAVRRFHEGIRWRDDELIAEVTVPPRSPRERGEIAFMKQLTYVRLSRGNRFRLRNRQREPKRQIVAQDGKVQNKPETVYLTADYSTPNRSVFANVQFVVERDPMGWRINVHETLALWNKYVPSGPMATNG
jgi:hypothetical protein